MSPPPCDEKNSTFVPNVDVFTLGMPKLAKNVKHCRYKLKIREKFDIFPPLAKLQLHSVMYKDRLREAAKK